MVFVLVSVFVSKCIVEGICKLGKKIREREKVSYRRCLII